MKYTTVIAASMAAGVSADSWSQWSSSSSSSTSSKPVAATSSAAYCPSKVTETHTTTATCAEHTSEIYSTTITVDSPKTKTVTVGSDGKTAENVWEEWTATSSIPAAPTSLPAGCVPKVETETATEWVTKTGSSTTVYKSTLFVGGGEAATTTVTITEAGSWPTGSASTGSGEGWPVGASISIGDSGISVGVSDKIVGTGYDVYQWTVPIPTNTQSYAAPEYTQNADGNWGYEWGSWDGPGSDSPSKNATGGNGYNITAGSPGSNVTAPYLPLKDQWSCNDAGDRSKWCNGKNIDSDYYQDYFSGHTCTADLTITNTTLNFDGVERLAFAINGQVPGPLIECNWGDIIQVTVHNKLTVNGTSIHWHGFQQRGTNDMDGVPGVTECPLAPGESRTYTFHASSYGTTWYHSHFLAQYGDGVYGPIIVHGPATANYDEDMGTVNLQDTFNVTAAQQNWIIAHQGPKNTVNYLLNGHNTKWDLSRGQHALWEVEAGKKYLFRFINSAAQNMYSLSIDNHKFQVIAADFVPIVPYETEWLNIGIGQRYDVIVEMNQAVSSYFLRAVTQLGCPSACDNTGLGQANGIIAYKGVETSPYALPTSSINGGKTISDFNICFDEPLSSLVPHLQKPAGTSSAFSSAASELPVNQPTAVATSDDGVAFKWNINNGAINVNYTQPTLKSLSEGNQASSTLISNPIVLYKKNQWVYFIIQNNFFAAHPIHLHGHDFSILGQGAGDFDVSTQLGSLNFDNPMRRDTAMLQGAAPGPGGAPTGYTVIGFETDNAGAWLMHCHIVWHVDGGLALQWIERPDDIVAANYVDSEFKEECSAYATYEQQSPSYNKASWEAGLKKRTFFDEQVERMNANQFNDVVRRSDSAAKRYVDNMHLKRGVGDGYRPRHFGRK